MAMSLRRLISSSLDAPGGWLDRRDSYGILPYIGRPTTYVASTQQSQPLSQGEPTDQLTQAQPSPEEELASLLQAVDTPGGSTGGTGTGEPEGWSQYLDDTLYTDPAAYFSAILDALNLEGTRLKTRAREDDARGRSSLLDQVARLFEDIDTQEKKGQGDISQYYSSLGDIYQSSEDVRRNELAADVTKERGRVTKDKDTNLAAMDRALNDYLEGVDRTINDKKTSTFNTASEAASSLASGTGALSTYNPSVGAVQLQDRSALLRNLNQFLEPTNVRNRYRGETPNGANPIYSYLNAV